MTATPPGADLRTLAEAMCRAFREYTGSAAGDNMWNLNMEKTFEIVAPAALAAVLGPNATYSTGQVDLRTLAAEALRHGDHALADAGECGRREDQLAVVDAILAAVLPEHRRIVLGEAADELRNEDAFRTWYIAKHPYACIDIGSGRFFAEYLTDRRLAAAAPAVPEDTPGGFHEPDEPTDHIQAAFDAGTHGRTAPPRGQTRRLDVDTEWATADGMKTGAEMALGEAQEAIRRLTDERDKAVRERDSLARRCALRFEETERLRADRDRAGSFADDLAGVIFEATGVPIGEHSNVNDPWGNALAAGEDLLAELRERGQLPLNAAAAQVAHYQRVFEAAKAWRAARPGPWVSGTDVEFHLFAAVDALPDAGTDQTEDDHEAS